MSTYNKEEQQMEKEIIAVLHKAQRKFKIARNAYGKFQDQILRPEGSYYDIPENLSGEIRDVINRAAATEVFSILQGNQPTEED